MSHCFCTPVPGSVLTMSGQAVCHDPLASPNATANAEAGEPALARLQHVIDHAAHLLPAQGPISVFIHHNTLHAFEHLPFEEAVERGGEVFGCQPYLSEEKYREALVRGRIRVDDLRAVLVND